MCFVHLSKYFHDIARRACVTVARPSFDGVACCNEGSEKCKVKQFLHSAVHDIPTVTPNLTTIDNDA